MAIISISCDSHGSEPAGLRPQDCPYEQDGNHRPIVRSFDAEAYTLSVQCRSCGAWGSIEVQSLLDSFDGDTEWDGE